MNDYHDAFFEFDGWDRSELLDLIVRLRELASHARHDEGCNASHGLLYRCKCGYSEAAVAVARVGVPV